MVGSWSTSSGSVTFYRNDYSTLGRCTRSASKGGLPVRKPLFEHCDLDAICSRFSSHHWGQGDNTKLPAWAFNFRMKLPKHLLNTSFPKTNTTSTLRQRTPSQFPVPNTSLFQLSPFYFAWHTFNNLPPHLRSINTLLKFKRIVQQHILSYSCPCSRRLN